MTRWPLALVLAAMLGASHAGADDGTVRVGIVINPYAGDRAGPEQDEDAAAMAQGLDRVIEEAGGAVAHVHTVALTAEDERAYGRWNRFGIASGHLAEFAKRNRADGMLNVGLYNNCGSLMGMLGGLRHSGQRPLTVGLVWIDAHGDYNTPETTLSGMLGGMPVAIAAGDALTRMREQAMLDVPIAKEHILMVAVRDTDPLEEARIVDDGIARIGTDDVRTLSPALAAHMRTLTEATDVVYVHVDLDVLDPAEVSGHPLTVPDGPTGAELADAIRVMFQYPKTDALGIASYPHTDDPGGLTLLAVRRMVAAAIQGIRERGTTGD